MYNRIKELRTAAGLSQQELATRVGVRRETIVFLEKARYNPSLRLAHDIARTFGRPIEEIFLFDDEPVTSAPGEKAGG